MRFTDAIEVLLHGGGVARNGWPNDERCYIDTDGSLVHTRTGAVSTPYFPKRDDLAADDWVSIAGETKAGPIEDFARMVEATGPAVAPRLGDPEE